MIFFSIFLLFRAKNTGKLFSLYFLGVSRRDKIFVESEQSTITSDWFKDFRRNDAMRGVVSCRIILSVHTVRESRELQSSPLQLTATCLLLRRQRGLHYPHSRRASTKHRKHPMRCLHVERCNDPKWEATPKSIRGIKSGKKPLREQGKELDCAAKQDRKRAEKSGKNRSVPWVGKGQNEE